MPSRQKNGDARSVRATRESRRSGHRAATICKGAFNLKPVNNKYRVATGHVAVILVGGIWPQKCIVLYFYLYY